MILQFHLVLKGVPRMNTFRPALLLLALALPPPSTTYAQSVATDPADGTTSNVSMVSAPRRYREFSFYTAQSFADPQIMSGFGGKHLFFMGVRLTSRLFTAPHMFIDSNLDLKPLAIYSRHVSNCTSIECAEIGDTYGGGGSAGFQLAARNSWRWQPFFDMDGGLIAFTHDVPFANTRRVNLTLEYGPGALIPVRGNSAIRAGVWVFHFSNASTGPYRWNPGFDGLMVYAAYTYRNFSPHLFRR